jgi:acetamidase/formamidase
MKRIILLASILMSGVTALAETHRFVPLTFYNTFSFAHPPVLRIKPGDRVITRTIDAGGMDANDQRVPSGPNPQTGPFYVEGAEPGDMLVVTLRPLPTDLFPSGFRVIVAQAGPAG